MQDGGSGNMDTVLFLLIVIAGVGVAIVFAIRGRKRKTIPGQPPWQPTHVPDARMNQQAIPPASYAKRCPTCQSIYADQSLAFCLSDGSTLELVPIITASNVAGTNFPTASYDPRNVPPTVRYDPNNPQHRG